VSVAIAFVVGYAAIAWLLKFVSHHSLNWFGVYRVVLGVVLLILLGTGVVASGPLPAA
jgi:undecaprenyl-diphosphatase